MIIILVVIIIILILVILLQYFSIKERNKNLSYITKKLESIILNNTSEKLLVVTDDDYITSILVQINNILEHNQKVIANHKRTEESMRKMLSNISHDLKTPLTVIIGYIETLRVTDELNDEEKDVYLVNVQNKASELVELINEFFTLSKIESGDKEIPITRININEICRKNILSFYDILTNKGFEVSINIPSKNIYALANEEAMDRILNNLISNAIKYGHEGKCLGLDISYDEEEVYIDIWDRGRGIDEVHKEKVFERLYTLEDSRNKEFQGSGLGLTITKRLVEKMNGEITLSSIPYAKTTFSLKLKRINF